MVGDISFQQIYVLFGLKHHTVETGGAVTNGATPYSIGAALVSNGAGSGSTRAVPGSTGAVPGSTKEKYRFFSSKITAFLLQRV